MDRRGVFQALLGELRSGQIDSEDPAIVVGSIHDVTEQGGGVLSVSINGQVADRSFTTMMVFDEWDPLDGPGEVRTAQGIASMVRVQLRELIATRTMWDDPTDRSLD